MPFLNRTVFFALPTRRKQNPPARRAVRPMARLLKRSHVEAVSTSTDVPASLTSRLSPLASRRSLALVPAGTLQGLDHLSKSDARLLRSIERLTDQQIDAMSGRPRVTAFTSLCKSITSQQVSTAAARTIFGRFQGVAPAPTDNDDDTGDNVCPHAVHECSHETLRGAGLSNAKTRAVKDLAARFVDGSLTEQALSEAASINELEELLLDVRGIGAYRPRPRPRPRPCAPLSHSHSHSLVRQAPGPCRCLRSSSSGLPTSRSPETWESRKAAPRSTHCAPPRQDSRWNRSPRRGLRTAPSAPCSAGRPSTRLDYKQVLSLS